LPAAIRGAGPRTRAGRSGAKRPAERGDPAMRGRFTVWAIVAVALLIVLANTLFVVDQRQQAIVLRLGQPVRVVHAPGQGGAGLNIKAPFVENVIKFDRRNLALEADQEEV